MLDLYDVIEFTLKEMMMNDKSDKKIKMNA